MITAAAWATGPAPLIDITHTQHTAATTAGTLATVMPLAVHVQVVALGFLLALFVACALDVFSPFMMLLLLLLLLCSFVVVRSLLALFVAAITIGLLPAFVVPVRGCSCVLLLQPWHANNIGC